MKITAIVLFGACLILAIHGKPVLRTGHIKGKIAARAAVASFASALTTTSEVYNRPNSYSDAANYYQAVQVIAKTSGTYIFQSQSELDTMGYFYHDSFDPSQPEQNLVLEDDDSGDDENNFYQFRIEAFLEAERIYYLVITTHGEHEKGDFSIVVDGAEAVDLTPFTATTSQPITAVTTAATFLSSVAGALSTEGGLYIRPEIDEVDEEGFYFEAFEISVETSGTYTLTSESDMDTMGFLYQDSFDPSVPTGNLVNEDDDNGEGVHQFSIEHYFEAGKTYILVVTTHETSETGDFTVKGFGPGSVSLTSFTPTTSQPIGVNPVVAVASAFANELSSTSLTFSRPEGDEEEKYYYHAIEITATVAGIYTFSSHSDLDTMGYFYDTTFDPADPVENLMVDDDDDSEDHLQFKIKVYLQANHKYILVVTTHQPTEVGSFSISTKGPAAINLRSNQ